MTKRKTKCPECGGRNPERCEACWERAIDEDDELREREIDRRIDEARGK